uniref:Rho GTPase-activating protein 15 n=1 Tax=Sparus aurata TaxID=8175 RepID=A0A671TVA1_SPAAU
MAGTRITNLQSAGKQPPLAPPRSPATQGAVQLRIKSSQIPGDRLSQSKSMVLQESDLPPKPISRHRRNQSQHNVLGSGGADGFEPLVKGEHLNVAKISDGGKKQRKNWTQMWSVLTSDQLLLYKERQQEASQKAAGKTDVVHLCGAVIEWTTEKSSRKNVFQITTNTGSEYLLQADSNATASKWYDAIRKTIDSSTKADGGFPLRRSNSTEYLPRHSSLPGYSSASPSTKQRNPVHRRSINMFGSSKLKHSTSDSADKNGVKNRLKKFITRRPSMKTLQEKGLIKDRVFGCHLSTLCEREGTTVPKFVQICLDAVEKRGMEADGIYRVSGNLATIQKLRFIVDQEEDLDLDHSQWEDIHVVTGALKMFFPRAAGAAVPLQLLPAVCGGHQDQRRQSKSSGCEETDPESAQTEPRHHEAALQPPAQSSGLLQEEPDVHSGHRHRVRPNADVARAGRRKHGGQHGLPEPDRRVHPHREPTNLQPRQEVKRPGSEVDRII